MRSRRLVAFLVLLCPLALRAESPGVYALTGGTVHPVSGPAIPNGVVVVRNGLIEAVGPAVAVPADAAVLDVQGAHVYPGLIDAQTSAGFPAAPSGRAGRSGGGSERPAEPGPDSLAARNVKLSDEDAGVRRATGVTALVTAPSNGIFNGQSVLLVLGSGPLETRVLRSPAALQIAFTPRPTWTYPDSLMGVLAMLRQDFLDAQRYGVAHDVYMRAPAGLNRPEANPGLEALQPVLRREVPVVFLADSVQMMRRAQALAAEFNLRFILSGARQAYAMAPELKGIPVLVSVKWPAAPADKLDREDQPLRVIRDRQLAPASPAELAKNGVTFALVSGAGSAGDFLPGIRKAIENGLSADDALRATTIVPARIFGVDRQLGTLEKGKIANLIVSDKPLFDKDAKVTRVFVDGREIRLPAEEKKGGESPAPAIDGTWSLSVRAPEGNVSIQVTLHAADGQLTGTYSGDRGSGEVRGGTFDGTAFQFTISAAAGAGAETSDWVFAGTLDGKSMTGSVTTTLGKFDFSGSRSE